MKDRYVRQRDLINPKIFNQAITIVGAGGIGSFLVLTLAKMGFKDIMVYDFDKVEDHNLPNQFYHPINIGQSKVSSLNELVRGMTGTEIKVLNGQWLTKFKNQGVLISCVDNMDTRKAMFDYAIKNPKRVPWFIDGRMGRLQAEVYIVNTSNKRDIALYKSRLWKQSEVENLRCTEKAIIYNVLFISAMICAQMKLALEGKIYKPAMVADLANSTFSFLKGEK